MFIDDPRLNHLMHVHRVENVRKKAQHAWAAKHSSRHHKPLRDRLMLKLGEFLIRQGSRLKYPGNSYPCENDSVDPMNVKLLKKSQTMQDQHCLRIT
jgi:hypothetical protein